MHLNYTLQHFSELTTAQLYDIMRLRQEIFIVEQNCPYLDADGKDLKAVHLMGRDNDGILISYARLLDEGISYPGYSSIGRVINAQRNRGIGAGKELMSLAVYHIGHLYPQWPVKIGAQSYLKRFYEGFGFIDTGLHYLEDGIPHMEMIRDVMQDQDGHK